MRKVRKDRETVSQIMERLSGPISENGCIPWLGKIGTGGYAYVLYREGSKRLTRKAATVALELAGRPRPEGLEVDHLCRNRTCVNPDHMRYTTRSGNSLNRSEYRWVPNCKHCGQLKVRTDWQHAKWTCRSCNAERAALWRENKSMSRLAARLKGSTT